MSKKNHFRNRKKVGDYVIPCDTCRMNCWASEATILSIETGKGGAVVCPNCIDTIDWGLVPYTIAPEDIVPIARDANYASNPQDVPNTFSPIDISKFDPMSTSPQTAESSVRTWDKLNLQTWDNWDTPWGS